ncbi:Ionotropic receptor 25a [Bulinus truncatus]|nr:Ionotropic receptor 25a [Bulinus truncatus]
MDVLTEIARTVGFTFTVRECHDGEYGSLEGGVWNGCIGNMLRGEADVILGTLTVTAERDNVIDFTLPYYDFAGIQILTRRQTSNINLFYYIDVFSTQAWLCLIAVVLLTSLLLWFFEKMTWPGSLTKQASEENSINRKVFQMNNGVDPVQYIKHALAYNNTTFMADRKVHADVERKEGYTVTRRGLGDNMWFVIGAVTMAGGGDPPKTVAGRVLVSGFWFFAIIIMSTFTANLAAFLTVSRMGATISNLDDLLGQTDMKYSVINRSSVMDYFKRMARIERNFYERWKNMTLEKSDSSNQDSLAVWEYPLDPEPALRDCNWASV